MNYTVENSELNLLKILGWPPNVFLILYTLIDYTDKYRLLVAPQPHFSWSNSNRDEIENLANEWEDFFGKSVLDKNSLLKSHLSNIFSQKNLTLCIYDLLNNEKNFCLSLFLLLLSIDKVFENSSLRKNEYTNLTNVEMGCFVRLIFKDTSSTKVENDIALENNLADNDTKFGFVSYKSLLPQSGLTVNNLCQNLTYLKPSVKPQIVYSSSKKISHDQKSYNVLCLPWPFIINDESFIPVKRKPVETDNYFDFFSYQPDESKINFTEVSRLFRSAIISSIKRVGNIDLIVLPECAMSIQHFDRLKEILWEHFKENSPSLLGGVYGRHDDGAGLNQARLSFVGPSGTFETISQNKHHRWYLDKSQIRAYNLASKLDPGKKWWEDIGVSRRSLVTLNTPDGIKLCPLVCEDLARQEPVAQAVRAIGPNFVISLLLDGPQLKSRWPGKYATVLSDEPGSSVLSVTALGMTQKSTGLGNPPSRTVALWSEPGKSAESIDLDEDGIGIILELNLEKMQCWSIDGRVSEKTIPRKIFHTTIKDNYTAQNARTIRDTLSSELKNRSVKI